MIFLEVLRDYGPTVMLTVVALEIRYLRRDLNKIERKHEAVADRVLQLERVI